MRTGLINIQWCPGCGDTLIIAAIKSAFRELGIESHQRVVVSGVGCSGKASQYIDGYAAETLHGRTLPFATGVKMANPELTVMAVGGDGDGYGIGMGHFIHACKRDLDITYVVFNNETYGLTTGQASPTTPIGAKTKTTPTGNTSAPIDPIALALTSGAKFAKRGDSSKMAELKEIIKEAIQHKGFSLVDVTQVCPSFKRW
ncbi:MAG: thiamine pyrophosphate-dependent enzyme [Candidatus Gracilibacteria bacterium]|nr:thiamine pyrophosphate-dependent enzyme [Candidatus Gracilibacteria bacterium]